MKFYSTNKKVSPVSLQKAVVDGLAGDRGLYMPERIPVLPASFFDEIEKFGLDNIFDYKIVDVHDKSEGLKEIIKKNNLNIEETVIIGDSNHEVEVGKEVGIKTIAVTWGFNTEEYLKSKNPDYLVHNIKELEEILL